MNTKFNTKETYLAYRSEWKASYNTLTNEIRALKKDARKSGHQITWTEYYALYKLKSKATKMLAERKDAKVEAQRQYLAAKTTEQEPVAA